MVEILSIQKEEEKNNKTPLFYFSIFLLIASFFAFLAFFVIEKNVQAKINNIQVKISEEKPADVVKIEQEITKLEKKINDFETLIKNHFFVSKIFGFIEPKIHPRVFVQKFDFNLENSLILLTGVTDDFYTLGQQVLFLENEPMISDLTLNKIQIGRNQMVEFELSFRLKKDLLKTNSIIKEVQTIKEENENI